MKPILSPRKQQQKSRKKARMTLVTFEEGSEDQDISDLVMEKAIRNSYTRRMSGAEKSENSIENALFLIKSLSFHLRKSYSTIYDRNWYIVQIDEAIFEESGFFDKLSICRNVENVQNYEHPHSLKLYNLTINMENKEFQFQSFENPEKHLFINFDTVPVFLDQIDEHHPFSSSKIALKVDKMLDINMYITPNTMPYPYKINASREEQERQAVKVKKSIEKLLKESIDESRGRQLSLSSVLKYESQFYKKRFVTEEQFVNFCETGDILLFKDNHTMAKVQRFVTNSEYDHIGIVYHHQKYGLCLFQSNSGSGVAIAVWNHLIRYHWFKGIEKITWRKLQVHNKPASFDKKVADFVNRNLNKKFGLSVGKILKRKVTKHTEKTSYFCSELVGTLYRHLGLLDPQTSATQYWPKHFSDSGGIKILNGALDPQRQIIFEDKLLKKTYPFYEE